MKTRQLFVLAVVVVIVAAAVVYFARAEKIVITEYQTIPQSPQIDPDYTDIIIPPNIAPLNFTVKESGPQYFVTIRGDQGDEIRVPGRAADIIIPARPWRELLQQNKGGHIYFDVYVRTQDQKWHRFETITNAIAQTEIDAYLVYRLIKPLYNWWIDIGIYQRDLSNYDESPVLKNTSFGSGCVNCHTFCKNDPDRMLMHTRSGQYGHAMIIVADGRIDKVVDKKAPAAYASWHPSGQIVAFSSNKVRQFFHTTGAEVRDVLDLASAAAYYRLDTQTMHTTPAISQGDRMEAHPCWSPDGKFLYYCTAKLQWSLGASELPPERYKEVKYELARAAYDITTDQWGPMEIILSAEQTGKSMTEPRISPDGRFLLFTMADYGVFPIYQPSADLCLMDLATRQYRRLDINSDDRCDSWHCWSHDGRWIVFSSKRRDGLFARPHFSYIDQNGKAYKPWVLPQRNPALYDSYLETYNVPELVRAKVTVTGEQLARVIRSDATVSTQLPFTGASPSAASEEPWRQALLPADH